MATLTQGTDLAATAVRSDELMGLGAEGWSTATVDPLVPTTLDALDLPTILHALSDPVRLLMITHLADGRERTCGSFELPVSKSTRSHHSRVLREAGVIAQRVDGKCRYNRLRRDELEQRFPGLLDAVLQASAA
ncbi:MAG TPA: helix-turn-helix transcriptional regulator [Solirubrobacteraceae bacterium]|jgi:DNA-binding transcriptional ArsR family regulator|nr:helix-turn-helix transcriptional regulator [Solirubrobacteraceae bacterium]